MIAVEGLLEGLIDYAGLFPPAGQDMHTAVRKYLEYRHSSNPRTLGRFVVNLDQFPYLWDAAGDYVRGLRLSVIAAPDADWDDLRRLLDKGYSIEAVEIKADGAPEVAQLASQIPSGLVTYFEVPVGCAPPSILDAIATAGARVKLRTGGVKIDAFPSTHMLAETLAEIARRQMIFKATAGLHHAFRGRYPLTYAPESPTAVMHGFVNLATAAAVLHFGGEAEEARQALDEEWPGAWLATAEAIAWQQNSWNADELREVREKLFAGFGSCSFEEPIRELEALRWL
jgi:hypothetical protein